MKPNYVEVKVRMYNNEPSFGKGVALLLHHCKELGSLSKAYKKMGMSNSKAWKILKRAEADLGFQLVNRSIGGNHGGGSSLTSQGEELLEKYDLYVQKLEAYSKSLFEEIFDE